MKTVEVKLYSINELSESVKKKVIEANYDINVDHDWWDFTYDDLVQEAESLGFDIKKDRHKGTSHNIYFGLHSQGSGLCFEYDMSFEAILEHYFDTSSISEARLRFLKKYACFSLEGKHSGHYYHENSVSHYKHDDFPTHRDLVDEAITTWQEEIESKVVEAYKDLCGKYYQILDDEYDHLTSEEVIAETIEVNEWLFTENGTRLNL